ncbi:hypothetical protein P3X46_030751 [Hevea brasiliensis]|uniref:FRIGIDA-like protein n=1 Tax=Hevea brasiliensis TaxID=3981 RepID=A0ABQ9KI45_HEVBR|nr:protein FRIGIDA [Hevea brasiliensis]KAJ9140064.1 hypothetical protein P3X46_030751 [Hevea brasiliensis]
MEKPSMPMSSIFNSTDRTAPLAQVKQEQQSIQTPLQPQLKGQPQKLPIVALQVSDQQQPQDDVPKGTYLFNSIEELSNLSTVISEFYGRYQELQCHLDFIQRAIDACSGDQEYPQVIQSASDSPPTAVTGKQTTEIVTTNSAPAKSELLSLCEMMCGKGLRKYLTSHLSDIPKLRAEVPPALKCAPNPAKLVLDCIGRFYLQGIRAYTKDSHMTPGRKASILVLEFFLRIIDNGIEFDSALKQEAEQAAVAWRKRLIAEGGVGKSSDIDARGLLLLIGCYGIPKGFTNEDIWDLIRLSNSKQIADALRRSPVLVARVSGILERMMNNGMKIEAVDVAYTFGIEDKFPPQKLLTSFLRDANEASKRRRREANNSPYLLKEASEKQLTALKSVIKLLEDRKLDPIKLLPGWQLIETRDKLEKEIADLNKKIEDRVTQKRKADENEFSNNLKSHEKKRLRFTGSSLISSPRIGLHEQRATGHVEGSGLYSTSLRMSLLDGGFSGHINNSSVAGSMLYGSGVGSLPEHVLGTVAGVGSVMHGTGVGLAPAYSIPSTSSFAGVHRDMLVDRTGQKMSRNVAYGWHGVGDPAFIDFSREQSFVHQPASGLFGPSPSIEGFVGVSNSPPTNAANRNSTSDLYRFADAVK